MWSAWLMGWGVKRGTCAYIICMMRGPWVTNRRYNDVPGRAEQFLHGGGDGAGREQQPTGLLAAWGTKACLRLYMWSDCSNAATCSEHDKHYLWNTPSITCHYRWSSCCGLWFCGTGRWSNFPGGELDSLPRPNLGTSTKPLEEFYSGLCIFSLIFSLKAIVIY